MLVGVIVAFTLVCFLYISIDKLNISFSKISISEKIGELYSAVGGSYGLAYGSSCDPYMSPNPCKTCLECTQKGKCDYKDQGEKDSRCPENRPSCSGTGSCVCSRGSDCKPCYKCNVDKMECEKRLKGESDNRCPEEDKKICDGNGDCIGCTIVKEIVIGCEDPAKPKCHEESHTCVQCLTHMTCILQFLDNPICDDETHECIGCRNDKDCEDLTPSKPACIEEEGKCVECEKDEDCSEFLYRNLCKVEDNECVECKTDDDCAENTYAKFCDLEQNFCAECKENSDCEKISPILHYCNKDLEGGTCQECEDDSDCGEGLPYCNPVEHICKECKPFGQGGLSEEKSGFFSAVFDFISDAFNFLTFGIFSSGDDSADTSVVSVSRIVPEPLSDCKDPKEPYCDPDAWNCEPCVYDEHCTEEYPYCIGFAFGGDSFNVCDECSPGSNEGCEIPKPICVKLNKVFSVGCTECIALDSFGKTQGCRFSKGLPKCLEDEENPLNNMCTEADCSVDFDCEKFDYYGDTYCVGDSFFRDLQEYVCNLQLGLCQKADLLKIVQFQDCSETGRVCKDGMCGEKES